MAIRTRQELGYAPDGNSAHDKSPDRDILEFVNDEGEVVFFIETTKEWVTETVEGYLGDDPDIEGHTFQFLKTTTSWGTPSAADAPEPEFREVDP
jgi:hypothetical protein